ncbi:MAG TPA: aldo/keto reductase [Bacillota bacterium]|nr:aldo/keto reductase [Bacillota bacterium]
MKLRYFGNTGLQVSRLGLGGIPVQRQTQAEANELIKAALEAGINFIDSARGYGASEQLLGQALADYRSSFILASKSMQRSKAGILKDINISLTNLQTDYLDIYQIHNVRSQAEWDAVTDPEGALAGLEEARRAGLIRHIGFTSHSAEFLAKALESEAYASVMFPYNIVEKQGQQLFARAHDQKVGTLAMKPLAGGFIQDTSLGLRYLAGDQNLDCLLVGMGTAEEVQANVQALKQGPLAPEELSRLEDWASTAGQDFCRRCGYCGPCPQGIDIPTVFLLEGYYDRYELQGWAQERYASMPVPATECQSCGACVEKCPYDLPIPTKLAAAAQKLQK